MSARSFTFNKRRQGNITIDKTMVEGEGEQIRVILHKTAVVTVQPNGKIVLNSGGWRTVTTKTAINRALDLLGIKGGVSQVKGEWFYNGEKFEDGMTIV